jgi:hypothetical protein
MINTVVKATSLQSISRNPLEKKKYPNSNVKGLRDHVCREHVVQKALKLGVIA